MAGLISSVALAVSAVFNEPMFSTLTHSDDRNSLEMTRRTVLLSDQLESEASGQLRIKFCRLWGIKFIHLLHSPPDKVIIAVPGWVFCAFSIVSW